MNKKSLLKLKDQLAKMKANLDVLYKKILTNEAVLLQKKSTRPAYAALQQRIKHEKEQWLALHLHYSELMVRISQIETSRITLFAPVNPLLKYIRIGATKKAIASINHANINAQDHQGNTALHLAVIKNNYEVVQSLLNKKVNFRIKNNDGLTPRELAYKENCHNHILKVLTHAEEYCSVLEYKGI